MLPTQLKFTGLGHCYVQLPESFVSQTTSLKVGSIVSIRSIQSDYQIHAVWDGQVTTGDNVLMDLTFGTSNNLKEELIILEHEDKLNPPDSITCRVELLNQSDFGILGEHFDANLLDFCKLVSINLVIPIWLSQHVKVLVRVVSLKPAVPHARLTNWTEMQFQHSFENLAPQVKTAVEQVEPSAHTIENPVTIVSLNLSECDNAGLSYGALLVCGERGSGKTYLLKDIIRRYNKFHGQYYNCKQIRGKRPEAVRKKFGELLTEAINNQPSLLALDDIDSFVSHDTQHDGERGLEIVYRARLVDTLRQLIKSLHRGDHQRRIALICSSRNLGTLDKRISKPIGRAYFNQIISLDCPDIKTRIEILKTIIGQHDRVTNGMSDEEVEHIANKCSSYMPSDLKVLVERAVIGACSRSLLEFNSEPLVLASEDFLSSLEDFVPANLRGVSLQKDTGKTFDDVGGMDYVKQTLKRTMLLPIKYPTLFKRCALKSQSSVLLYGPPGCGKTLIAEALINQGDLRSICVRGPELLSKYIGASEAAVRDLFRQAELARPCVIFFDEFESLVAKRGADSTGVTDRIVNQFLTIMDGVERLSSDVFIVAATSRPDMIDPAILRPGRLDKHIYCGPPDENERLSILKVMMRNVQYESNDTDASLLSFSRKLEAFTGADIQSLLYSAQMKALHQVIDEVSGPKQERLNIRIGDAHLCSAYDDLRAEVEQRYATFARRYPKDFGKTSAPIASRATLV